MKLQLPEAAMATTLRRLRRLRLTSCNCANSGLAGGEPGRGVGGEGGSCGAGSGVGVLGEVFPFKSMCSFIYSCGDDGAGMLETFLPLKIKNTKTVTLY